MAHAQQPASSTAVVTAERCSRAAHHSKTHVGTHDPHTRSHSLRTPSVHHHSVATHPSNLSRGVCTSQTTSCNNRPCRMPLAQTNTGHTAALQHLAVLSHQQCSRAHYHKCHSGRFIHSLMPRSVLRNVWQQQQARHSAAATNRAPVALASASLASAPQPQSWMMQSGTGHGSTKLTLCAHTQHKCCSKHAQPNRHTQHIPAGAAALTMTPCCCSCCCPPRHRSQTG